MAGVELVEEAEQVLVGLLQGAERPGSGLLFFAGRAALRLQAHPLEHKRGVGVPGKCRVHHPHHGTAARANL